MGACVVELPQLVTESTSAYVTGLGAVAERLARRWNWIRFRRNAGLKSTAEVFTVIDLGGDLSGDELNTLTAQVRQWTHDADPQRPRRVEIWVSRRSAGQIGLAWNSMYNPLILAGQLNWLAIQSTLQCAGVAALVRQVSAEAVGDRELMALQRGWPLWYVSRPP